MTLHRLLRPRVWWAEVVIRGLFERRGREGFAEGAKKIQKKYKKEKSKTRNEYKNIQQDIYFYKSCKYLMYSFWFYFGIFFFAFSAKPSRPLRSKN
jgi:hypothetical protein